MSHVYIEDYVVSFLKQKKTEATTTPIKLALYGTTIKPETLQEISDTPQSTHYIYGAAALEGERTTLEIGTEYFPDYQFLGFVNIHNNDNESISTYHIFYDENTAMQDYLLYYYMSPYSIFRGQSPSSWPQSPFAVTTDISTTEPDKSLKIVKIKKNLKKTGNKSLILSKLKIFVLSLLCLMAASSVSTINDYEKMSDFIEITKIVINFEK